VLADALRIDLADGIPILKNDLLYGPVGKERNIRSVKVLLKGSGLIVLEDGLEQVVRNKDRRIGFDSC
jgi:hypothetical protein